MGKRPAPGWWQTADGQWRPPHEHPEYERLLEETRRDSAAHDWVAAQPTVAPVPRLSPAHHARSSPYALVSTLVSAASLVAFLFGGWRLWLWTLVPGTWLLWRTRRWTEDGNGGEVMGRIAKVAFLGGVVPPLGIVLFAVGSSLIDAATEGPKPWELERGQCFDVDTSEDPADRPANWVPVKVVGCETSHDGEVLLATNMEVGRKERVDASRSEDPTAHWHAMAATMCHERLGDEVVSSIPEAAEITHLRWWFENLTRQMDPPGYGFLVCVAMNVDRSPLVGSVLPR
jgi:hypothetical protein